MLKNKHGKQIGNYGRCDPPDSKRNQNENKLCDFNSLKIADAIPDDAPYRTKKSPWPEWIYARVDANTALQNPHNALLQHKSALQMPDIVK